MEKLKTFVDWGQKGWDSFFVQKGNRWRDKDYRYLDTIFDLYKLNGSLLDVGCALGDGLVYLGKKCTKVDRLIGTDYSNKAIESCRNNQKLKKNRVFSA